MTEIPESPESQKPSRAEAPTPDTNEMIVRKLAAKLQAQQVSHQAQVAVLTKKLEECRERYSRQGALLANQIATILEKIEAIRRSMRPSGPN